MPAFIQRRTPKGSINPLAQEPAAPPAAEIEGVPLGTQPDRPVLGGSGMLASPFLRAGQHLHQLVHAEAPFNQEMVAGAVSLRGREFLPLRVGWGTNQLTPVAAPFTPDMVQGSVPARFRELLSATLHHGWRVEQHTPVAAPFSVEMAQGWQPTAPVRLTPPPDWIAVPPDVPVFSVEMFVGSHPDLPRLFLAPRIPLPESQPNHVEAPFGPEMAQGSIPERPRIQLAPRIGVPVVPPTIDLFSIDMVIGARPDLPRLFLAPRIPLPASQPTHVDAPFSPEMVTGWAPLQPRLFIFPKLGWSVTQATHVAAPLSIEMTRGSQPEQPRLPFAAHVGWETAQRTHVAAPFSIEMSRGSVPARYRQLLPLRVGWDVSQPTHVEAPFSVEMAQGQFGVWLQRPDQRLRTGWAGQPPDVSGFSIEMVAGWQPAGPWDARLRRYALRPGWQTAQTTHVASPFGIEMVRGAIPPTGRLGVPHRIDWGVGITTTIATVVGVAPERLVLGYTWTPLQTPGLGDSWG